MDQFSYFGTHLRLLVVQSVEAHHMAVVGIVAAHLAVLVTLVDTGHTGQGDVEHFHQQRTFVRYLGVADTDLLCPAFLFALAVYVDGSARDGRETYLVVVTADVTHRVVRTVGGKRRQFVVQHRVHARQPAQCLTCREIDVEIELGIQHTGFDVTANQLRTAVGLADHPYRTTRPTGSYLLS